MSFIATYQAKKNLIAQKLNEKGVEASGSEGLSSLIDKINNIEETVGEYSKTVTLTWNDNGNAKGMRPDSVQVFLIRNNEKVGVAELKPSNQWSYTFTGLSYNTGYSVQGGYAECYTVTNNNLNTTYTLNTGHLRLNTVISGAPEGADLSDLSIYVDGADPSMPLTLGYGQIVNGQYDLGQLLPGAYVVRTNNADSLVEGYVINNTSCIADAIYLNSGATSNLSIDIIYNEPEEVEYPENPTENIGQLTFEVLGPDERMPITMIYSQFINSTYVLDDLTPGTYAVIERNPMNLIDGYFLTSASVICGVIIVQADGSSSMTLFSQYRPLSLPEAEEEFIDIPTSITWNDNNNTDLNRPANVTIRLYADGAEVDSHVCSSAENWSYTFTEKPRYQEDGFTEIIYSTNIDAIAMYHSNINGYDIVCTYDPEVTSTSVSKTWNDNNNAQNLRPSSLAMSLSNGSEIVQVVILNELNNWTATVDNLPTVVNGQSVNYTWTEQEITGYTLDTVQQQGNHMTFTNSIWQRPDVPGPGKPPKTK